MKLPDFRQYEPLNRLKDRMGIPRDEYGTVAVVVTACGSPVEQLKDLSSEDIDVRQDDVTPPPACPPLPETLAE